MSPTARHFMGDGPTGERLWRDARDQQRRARTTSPSEATVPHPQANFWPNPQPSTGPLPPPDYLHHVDTDGEIEPAWLASVEAQLNPAVAQQVRAAFLTLGGMFESERSKSAQYACDALNARDDAERDRRARVDSEHAMAVLLDEAYGRDRDGFTDVDRAARALMSEHAPQAGRVARLATKSEAEHRSAGGDEAEAAA